jgi:hypothetical protein
MKTGGVRTNRYRARQGDRNRKSRGGAVSLGYCRVPGRLGTTNRWKQQTAYEFRPDLWIDVPYTTPSWLWSCTPSTPSITSLSNTGEHLTRGWDLQLSSATASQHCEPCRIQGKIGTIDHPCHYTSSQEHRDPRHIDSTTIDTQALLNARKWHRRSVGQRGSHTGQNTPVLLFVITRKGRQGNKLNNQFKIELNDSGGDIRHQ